MSEQAICKKSKQHIEAVYSN